MRKVLLNKWVILSAILTISLSAFSFVAYKKVRQVCAPAENCSQSPGKQAIDNELLIDAFSRQFTSFIYVP